MASIAITGASSSRSVITVSRKSAEKPARPPATTAISHPAGSETPNATTSGQSQRMPKTGPAQCRTRAHFEGDSKSWKVMP